VLGLLFGVVFGFLLQKGGVAKYEVLMGQFFLTDFAVIRVMLTAIIVGMLGYCPGTGVAALGQGNYDAIAGILGIMAGSYFYAETSAYIRSTIQRIGNRGGIILPDLLGMRLAVFLALFVPLLVLGLFVIAQLARGR